MTAKAYFLMVNNIEKAFIIYRKRRFCRSFFLSCRICIGIFGGSFKLCTGCDTVAFSVPCRIVACRLGRNAVIHKKACRACNAKAVWLAGRLPACGYSRSARRVSFGRKGGGIALFLGCSEQRSGAEAFAFLREFGGGFFRQRCGKCAFRVKRSRENHSDIAVHLVGHYGIFYPFCP